MGDKDTQTLGALTVTSEEGSEAGKTALTVEPQIASINNVYKYKEAATATTVTYGMDVKNWAKWDGASEITATKDNHITVVEADQNYKAVRSGDAVARVKA